MGKYLKMADVFKGELFIDSDFDDVIVDDLSLTVLESFSGSDAAKFALHAINSHDELVEEVERLRESLKWAVENLPFENAFEWSDDENADAHYAALRLLGVEVEE